ncbi:MAG: type I restriction-modification system subunit M [Bacteroidales bacterium]|nr:type I restriction-modification system subunit M [Bacteroidales bacterium]
MITKQALGNTLFGMADILRDKVEDYKSYILSLLFFKRLSDNYLWENENSVKEFIRQNNREPNDAERKLLIRRKHDFVIPDGCFWEDVRIATPVEKNKKLNDAVNGIADANKDPNGNFILKGIINTVRWNEPAPDGSGGTKLAPEVLTNLINYLSPVDLSNRNASVDVLGDAYEYLIKRFADENRGGTTAGQFYTPQEVVDIIVRYLKPERNDAIYDPTCGSGGFLINSAKYAKEKYGSQKNVRIFGQENVWNTWAICNINMILHGLDANIKQGDTILSPKFVAEDNPLQIRTFDKVMANFPFSQENWAKNGEPKKDRNGKPVNKKDGSPQLEYSKEFTDNYQRLVYGMPPYSNGDFMFLQHIIASVKEGGKAGVVCPQGVLFRGQPEKTEEEDGQNRKADEEYNIRRGLLTGRLKDGTTIGANIIDAIVVLPNNLFYGTTIPGSILFINKNKPEARKNKVLMVYAAKEGWYREESNLNILEPQDILRISTILESWGDIEVAQRWIAEQKIRLNANIQDNLQFKLSEIAEETADAVSKATERLAKAQKAVNDKQREGKKLTAGDRKSLETAQNALDKLMAEKAAKENDCRDKAQKSIAKIEEVESELLAMLADPELRRRYFSVVDMDEIEENEYNLNIPRYVDTFEPEEEIDLAQAIADYQAAAKAESEVDSLLNALLKTLKGGE